jgi:hypothetical protein
MTNVPQSRLPRNVRLCSLTLGVSAGLAVLMLATILAAWRHFEAAAEVYRSASLSGGMGDPVGELQWMRSDLGYDAAVVAAMALVTAGLAPLIRRPLRWARVATWCAAVVLGSALLVELGGGPDAGGRPLDPETSVLDSLRFDLVPQWFSGVNAVLGFAVLVLVIVSAVLLLRSSVSEFYRPAGQQQDPQWAAFLRAQNDRIAGDGKPAGEEGS